MSLLPDFAGDYANAATGLQPKQRLEVEVRFGNYSAGTARPAFESTVLHDYFERLLRRLRQEKYVEVDSTSTVIYYMVYNHLPHWNGTQWEWRPSSQPSKLEVREIALEGKGDDPSLTTYEIKTHVSGYPNDIVPYGVRLDMSVETTVLAPPQYVPLAPGAAGVAPLEQTVVKTYERGRQRSSFTSANKLVRIDMTRVTTVSDVEINHGSSMEIELEYIGPQIYTPNLLAEYRATVEQIYLWMRGSTLLYTSDQLTKLIANVQQKVDKVFFTPNQLSNYTRRVGQKIDQAGFLTSGSARDDVLVKARQLTKKDLVYGGVVGNPTSRYAASIKVDGKRMNAITDETGLWIVFPPHEFSLVSRVSFPYLTILDGEYIDTGIFVPFDALFLTDVSVINQPYTSRIGLDADPKLGILEQVGRQLMADAKVDIFRYKRAVPLLSVDNFFAEMRNMFAEMDTLPYPQDGIVLTPMDTPYTTPLLLNKRETLLPPVCGNVGRPYTEYLPTPVKGDNNFTTLVTPYYASQRTAARVVEPLKYKDVERITIDFTTRRVNGPNGIEVQLYSYRPREKKEVQFKGTDLVELTPSMIDHNAPMTAALSPKIVVEYQIIRRGKSYWLTPLKLRPDKSGPNKEDVAIHNWTSITDPLTRATMRGESFELVFAYFNRVKARLYHYLPANSGLLDIGSGFLQDLYKWVQMGGSTRIVAVEPSEVNRETAQIRLREMKRDRTTRWSFADNVRLLPTGGEDINSIVATVRQHIGGADDYGNQTGRVQSISLMLSLSFFFSSSDILNKLVATIVNTIAPGGRIVFLTINGDAVRELFRPQYANITTGRTIEGNPLVRLGNYSSSPTFTWILDSPGQQMIRITVPESDIVATEGATQTEYLVSIDTLLIRLRPYGFKLGMLHRCDDEKFLTAENMTYSSCFVYGMFCHDGTTPLPNYPRTSNPVQPIVIGTGPTSTSTPISPAAAAPIPAPISAAASAPVPISAAAAAAAPVVAGSHVPSWYTNITPSTKSVVAATAQPTPAYVRSLPVSPTSVGDQPSAGDDVMATLVTKWGQPLSPNVFVRMATLGLGSCLVHALLKACDPTYQNNRSGAFRRQRAAQFRRAAADRLATVDPRYTPPTTGDPPYTYWETASNGYWVDRVMGQIAEGVVVDLVTKEREQDFSLRGIQLSLDSCDYLGDETHAYLAEMCGVFMYVCRAYTDNVILYSHTVQIGVDRSSCIIVNTGGHYETAGIRNAGTARVDTLFPKDAPVLNLLRTTTVESSPTVPFNPVKYEQDLITFFANAFVKWNKLQRVWQFYPPYAAIQARFPRTDPLVIRLMAMTPRLETAALALVAESNLRGPPKDEDLSS